MYIFQQEQLGQKDRSIMIGLKINLKLITRIKKCLPEPQKENHRQKQQWKIWKS